MQSYLENSNTHEKWVSALSCFFYSTLRISISIKGIKTEKVFTVKMLYWVCYFW